MSVFANIKQVLQRNFNKTAAFFVIFYVVGIVGMLLPFSFPLFVKLIPVALLLSSAALAFFHTYYNTKTIVIFISIYLIGFFVEVAGVNTGLIFGVYFYGESLGFKIFNTPLIIGLNWLLLVYITASVLEFTNWHSFAKVFFASTIMLGYDLVIEQIAPVLKMWHWQNENVPFKNYLAWFLLALLFHTSIRFFGVKTKNKLAPLILGCQLLFFVTLLIAFNI
jgi:putative membrane protein